MSHRNLIKELASRPSKELMMKLHAELLLVRPLLPVPHGKIGKHSTLVEDCIGKKSCAVRIHPSLKLSASLKRGGRGGKGLFIESRPVAEGETLATVPSSLLFIPPKKVARAAQGSSFNAMCLWVASVLRGDMSGAPWRTMIEKIMRAPQPKNMPNLPAHPQHTDMMKEMARLLPFESHVIRKRIASIVLSRSTDLSRSLAIIPVVHYVNHSNFPNAALISTGKRGSATDVLLGGGTNIREHSLQLIALKPLACGSEVTVQYTMPDSGFSYFGFMETYGFDPRIDVTRLDQMHKLAQEKARAAIKARNQFMLSFFELYEKKMSLLVV